MTSYQRYLSIIASLSDKLQSQLASYGLNCREVGHYVNALIKNSFDFEEQLPSATFQQLVAQIIQLNKNSVEKTLRRVIQVLDEQLFNLSIQQDEYRVQKVKTDVIEVKSELPKKIDFHLSTSTSAESKKQNPFQLSTPKSKTSYGSMLKEYYKPSDLTNDLDSIERNIQQTLERTRKLRMLLDYKTKQTRDKRSRFSSPEAQQLDQIFNE